MSGALGFLSWNFFVTLFVIWALFYLAYPLTWRRRRSKHALSLVILAGYVTALVATVALPYINATYLLMAGIHRPAVIERVTPFRTINIGRSSSLGDNVRYDLRVENEDGSKWKTHVHRDPGPLGPYLLANHYVAAGDRVTIAYVEGQKANVTLVFESSEAVWRARARSIEAGWSRMSPGENWVIQEVYRNLIDDFLTNHSEAADADTIARLQAMRIRLTEMPPAGLASDQQIQR